MAPGIFVALEDLFTELATRANAQVVMATDADKRGERFAARSTEMAACVDVPLERALHPTMCRT